MKGTEATRAKGKLTRGGWIVTESLFSMDGDAVDVQALTSLARRMQTSQYNRSMSIKLRIIHIIQHMDDVDQC